MSTHYVVGGPTPLEDYYDIDRDSIPPEFKNPQAEFTTSLTGTVRLYRNSSGETDVLSPEDFPVRRVLTVRTPEGTTYWTEDLQYGRKFDSDFMWTDLGVGRIPIDGTGMHAALYHLATGYLAGIPIKDVLRYAWRTLRGEKVQDKVTTKQAKRAELGLNIFSIEDKARQANPYYNSKDS